MAIRYIHCTQIINLEYVNIIKDKLKNTIYCIT